MRQIGSTPMLRAHKCDSGSGPRVLWDAQLTIWCLYRSNAADQPVRAVHPEGRTTAPPADEVINEGPMGLHPEAQQTRRETP